MQRDTWYSCNFSCLDTHTHKGLNRRKGLVQRIHWYPQQFTHFARYFDKNIFAILVKYLREGINIKQWLACFLFFLLSFSLENFFQKSIRIWENFYSFLIGEFFCIVFFFLFSLFTGPLNRKIKQKWITNNLNGSHSSLSSSESPVTDVERIAFTGRVILVTVKQLLLL